MHWDEERACVAVLASGSSVLRRVVTNSSSGKYTNEIESLTIFLGKETRDLVISSTKALDSQIY